MQLIPVVNGNSRALQEFQRIIGSVNTLIRSHVILLSIIQKKLNITDEEIQEAAESLVNEGKERAEKRRLQSEEAGTDEDGSGSGQSELLAAESGGGSADSVASVPGDGNGGSVCSGEPDASTTADSTSESKDG